MITRTLATAIFATIFASTAFAAEPTAPAKDEGKLPQTITVKCSAEPFPYAFKPNRKSWAIDRVTIVAKSDLVLKRQDLGGCFRQAIPGWKGSKTT